MTTRHTLKFSLPASARVASVTLPDDAAIEDVTWRQGLRLHYTTAGSGTNETRKLILLPEPTGDTLEVMNADLAAAAGVADTVVPTFVGRAANPYASRDYLIYAIPTA